MIGERLVALAVRRERLRVRAEGERRAIAEHAHGLAVPLAVVDQAAGCARWLRAHPLAVLAALLAVVAVRLLRNCSRERPFMRMCVGSKPKSVNFS